MIGFPTGELLNWFKRNQRDLPWREQRTPYAVWVSEVMLQQTVVAAVIEHYRRWMVRFPTVEKLAAANLQEVIRQWEGLGYYSRARNLHKASGLIMERHGGCIPADYDQLLELPGIGDYTASAILSIAFGKPYPVLDANVRRIMQRVLLVREWTKRAEKQSQTLLAESMPGSHPGRFNEALMELGQVVCRRTQPECLICPLAGSCLARSKGLQEQLPLKRRMNIEKLSTTLLLCWRKNEVLLTRHEKKLFRGLWLFPELPKQLQLDRSTHRVFAGLQERTHYYTKFANRLRPIIVEANALTDFEKTIDTIRGKERQWVPISSLDNFPMPSVYRKIAHDFKDWIDSRR